MNRTEYIGKLNALYVGDKNCLEELITAYDEKDQEIERLNNIINELEDWLNNRIEAFYYAADNENLAILGTFKVVLYKLKELKELKKRNEKKILI